MNGIISLILFGGCYLIIKTLNGFGEKVTYTHEEISKYYKRN